MPFEQKYGSYWNAGKKKEFMLAPLISVDILFIALGAEPMERTKT